ncbi:condensation domain-containing protein [Staphylococcus saprophyticus]
MFRKFILVSKKQLHAYSNYMIVVSIYALLLKKITGLNEFLIGIPIFNRPNPSFEEMLGSCVNTLPINISFTDITTIEQFFEDIKRKLVNLYSYQNVPLNIINQNISHDISTFQILCINQRFDNNNYESKILKSVDYNPNIGSKTYKYDFSLQMNPDLSATIQYNSNIISEEHFKRLIDKMMSLLAIPLLNKNINSLLEDVNID